MYQHDHKVELYITFLFIQVILLAKKKNIIHEECWADTYPECPLKPCIKFPTHKKQ